MVPTGPDLVRLEVDLQYRIPLHSDSFEERSLAPVQRTVLIDTGSDLLAGGLDFVHRIDPESGKTIASLPATGVVAGCLAARGQAVFACTDEGFVYGWNGLTNGESWQGLLDEPLGVDAVVHNDCLLVAARSGSLWCLDPQSGAEKWKFGITQIKPDRVSPVVRIIPTGPKELILWRALGEIHWLRFDQNGYVVVKTHFVNDPDFVVDSEPVVYTDRMVFPSTGERSLLVYFDHTRSVAAMPGLLHSAVLAEKTKNEPGLLIQNTVPLSDLRGPLVLSPDGSYRFDASGMDQGTTVTMVLQWNRKKSDANDLQNDTMLAAMDQRIELDDRGRFSFDGNMILDSRIDQVGSNILVRNGRKLTSVEVFLVSDSGWLYRYTIDLEKVLRTVD
jgi:hypothetical protein